MMQLYTLDRGFEYLSDLIDPETGEVLMALPAAVDNHDVEKQCINTVRFYKNIEAEYKAVKAERQLMAKREKSLKRQLDATKEYLRSNMEVREISKIDCPQFRISLVNNPPRVNPYNVKVIPEHYKIYTVHYDLQKMLDDLKKGVDIPGANLVQGNSVRIK